MIGMWISCDTLNRPQSISLLLPHTLHVIRHLHTTYNTWQMCQCLSVCVCARARMRSIHSFAHEHLWNIRSLCIHGNKSSQFRPSLALLLLLRSSVKSDAEKVKARKKERENHGTQVVSNDEHGRKWMEKNGFTAVCISVALQLLMYSQIVLAH